MRIFGKIFSFIVVVLLPLVPAITLWIMFENIAIYKKVYENDIIVLGGPIAAYFIILTALFFFYKRFRLPEEEAILEEHKARTELATKLQGHWVFKASEFNEDETIIHKGSATITKVKTCKLNITGNWVDETGRETGIWEAEDVLLQDPVLIISFSVPFIGNQKASTGFVRLTIKELGRTKGLMNGSWGILGRDSAGSVEYTKTGR